MTRFSQWTLLCLTLLFCNIGWTLEKTIDFPKTPEEVRSVKERADSGDAEAQYIVGMTYRLNKQMESAVEWIRKAAESGYAPAQNTLGMLYVNGNGVDKDEKQGYDWVSKSAAQNDPAGQYNLALLYLTGTGVAKDAAQATELLRKSADQNQPESQLLLGDLLLNKNRDAAMALFLKAAESGLPEAMYRYGVVMGDDESKRKDAIVWIQRAADAGFPEAQFMTGLLNYDAENKKPDLVATYQWFTLALNRADDDDLKKIAAEALTELKSKMTPKQIRDGDARVKAWKPRPYVKK